MEHFTGKERDQESGLDYFGARYYGSALGRFASPDPYEIVVHKNQGKSAQQRRSLLNSFISNPQAWNEYVYALDDPLKLVDVEGAVQLQRG